MGRDLRRHRDGDRADRPARPPLSHRQYPRQQHSDSAPHRAAPAHSVPHGQPPSLTPRSLPSHAGRRAPRPNRLAHTECEILVGESAQFYSGVDTTWRQVMPGSTNDLFISPQTARMRSTAKDSANKPRRIWQLGPIPRTLPVPRPHDAWMTRHTMVRPPRTYPILDVSQRTYHCTNNAMYRL